MMILRIAKAWDFSQLANLQDSQTLAVDMKHLAQRKKNFIVHSNNNSQYYYYLCLFHNPEFSLSDKKSDIRTCSELH